MDMDTLIAIAQSPWSERARWALDHHGLPYSEQAHAPILGELSLRRKVGRWRGPVSVPILVREGRAIHGSHAIARLADSAGRGPSLFGQAREEAIARWSSIAEQGASAGRALSQSLAACLANPHKLTSGRRRRGASRGHRSAACLP